MSSCGPIANRPRLRSSRLSLLLLLTAAAQAATLHVNQTTIQAALDKAVPRDTILIHAGTYRESIKVTRDNITLAAGDHPIVAGADILTLAKTP